MLHFPCSPNYQFSYSSCRFTYSAFKILCRTFLTFFISIGFDICPFIPKSNASLRSSANTFAHRAYLKAQFRWHLPTQESVPHSDIYLHLSSQSLRFSSSWASCFTVHFVNGSARWVLFTHCLTRYLFLRFRLIMRNVLAARNVVVSVRWMSM